MYQIIKIKFTGSYDAIDVTDKDSLETITQAGDNIEMIGNPIPEERINNELNKLNTPEVMAHAAPRFALLQLRAQTQGWAAIMNKQ